VYRWKWLGQIMEMDRSLKAKYVIVMVCLLVIAYTVIVKMKLPVVLFRKFSQTEVYRIIMKLLFNY